VAGTCQPGDHHQGTEWIHSQWAPCLPHLLHAGAPRPQQACGHSAHGLAPPFLPSRALWTTYPHFVHITLTQPHLQATTSSRKSRACLSHTAPCSREPDKAPHTPSPLTQPPTAGWFQVQRSPRSIQTICVPPTSSKDGPGRGQPGCFELSLQVQAARSAPPAPGGKLRELALCQVRETGSGSQF
jgi:hypothetical protein